MAIYRLIKRDGKFLIKRGFALGTYLDMKAPWEFFWWHAPENVLHYCLADSEEQAMNQLKKYKESVIAEKNKGKTKTLRWFF